MLQHTSPALKFLLGLTALVMLAAAPRPAFSCPSDQQGGMETAAYRGDATGCDVESEMSFDSSEGPIDLLADLGDSKAL